MYKFEAEFRKANPQTIGETDRHFDLDNYKDWLENYVQEYAEQFAIQQIKKDRENLVLEIGMLPQDANYHQIRSAILQSPVRTLPIKV